MQRLSCRCLVAREATRERTTARFVLQIEPMNDFDWSELPGAALALGRVVNAWRTHNASALHCRERAAAIRAGSIPAPAGMSEADWASFPVALDGQAAEWDAAAANDAAEFKASVAKVVETGRLTRAQTAMLTAVTTLDEADAAVSSFKRDQF